MKLFSTLDLLWKIGSESDFFFLFVRNEMVRIIKFLAAWINGEMAEKGDEIMNIWKIPKDA